MQALETPNLSQKMIVMSGWSREQGRGARVRPCAFRRGQNGVRASSGAEGRGRGWTFTFCCSTWYLEGGGVGGGAREMRAGARLSLEGECVCVCVDTPGGQRPNVCAWRVRVCEGGS